MWIYTLLLCLSVLLYSESKRHALQDYQKTDGVRLVAPPDSSFMMKSKKMSLGKCVRRCSRNRKLPFTCSRVKHPPEVSVTTVPAPLLS